MDAIRFHIFILGRPPLTLRRKSSSSAAVSARFTPSSLWQKVARALLASLGRDLRCRDLLVFQPILLHLDASIPAQCRGAPPRGTFATGC